MLTSLLLATLLLASVIGDLLISLLSKVALSDYVVTLVVGAIGAWIVKRTRSREASQFLEQACRVVYGLVEDRVATSPNKIDDKAALALQLLAEYFADHGRKLTPELAKEGEKLMKSMHGAERVGAVPGELVGVI